MNTNKNKDLNELIGKFYPAGEAQKCADDIRRGDEILAGHPAPAPRPELLADIRTQMLLAHHRSRKARHTHRVFGSMALAASVAVVCGLAWIFAIRDSATEQMALPKYAAIAQATQEIGTFTSELDLIEDSVRAIQTVDFDSSPAGYQSTVTSFETMLWKG